ncbi:MAG: hypothetical protein AABY22_00130 [Nanoarchaeota archaeon]
MNRKEWLKDLLKKKKLDGILIYSSWTDSGYGLALTGIKPGLFHYYFFNGKTELFLELSYFIPELSKKTNIKILPLKEDIPQESLKGLLKNFKKIGLV